MIIFYNHPSGQVVSGNVVGIAGGALVVSSEGATDGLARRGGSLVHMHQCCSLSEFSKIYNAFGGVDIVDDDGDPLCG